MLVEVVLVVMKVDVGSKENEIELDIVGVRLVDG